jgi:hypothetical protein
MIAAQDLLLRWRCSDIGLGAGESPLSGLPVCPALGSSHQRRRAKRQRAGLPGWSESGYAEGRNIVIDWWYGNGSYDHLGCDRELRHRKVDPMTGKYRALATKRDQHDYRHGRGRRSNRSGLVARLGQQAATSPGSMMTTDLSAKRLELR